MNKPGTSRRGVLWPAINPADGKDFEVLITQRRIRWLRKVGLRAIREAEFIVSWVLQKPQGVFKGLMRDSDEDNYSDSEGWLCYSAAPKFGFDDEGNEIKRVYGPPPTNTPARASYRVSGVSVRQGDDPTAYQREYYRKVRRERERRAYRGPYKKSL